MTIIFYATMQLIKLKNYGEPAIMTSLRDSYFTTNDEFTAESGLQIAFGISDYGDETEPIEDARYGQLKAYYKTWGLQDGLSGVDFEELPSKQCTRAQLGISDTESDEEVSGDENLQTG